MGFYGYWGGFAPYVSVAEKKAKAQKKLAQLKRKTPGISPLVVNGTKMVKTWWGKAWNDNLSKYADYANRIGRGRSYIKNGFVLDFKINKGEINSLVQGTGSQPYKVSVKIKQLNKTAEANIRKHCEGKIESLQELVEGTFPKDLAETFTAKGYGLFPTPTEIEFDCSCPDYASMCKHVSATLFGVGVKLDQDPKLFFLLRNTDMNRLISKAVKEKSKKMLKKADIKTSRVLSVKDAANVFGIDLDEAPALSVKPISKIKKSPKAAKSLSPSGRE